MNSNFVYYNSRPDKLNEIYPLKEKIILVNAKDLPANIRQSAAGLESISVREWILFSARPATKQDG